MRKTEYRRDLSEFVNGTVAQFKEICSDSSGQDSDVCYLVSGAESRLNYSVYVHDEAWIVDAALNMLAVTKPTTTCVPDVVVECKDEGTTIRSVQPCARGWLDRHSPRF